MHPDSRRLRFGWRELALLLALLLVLSLLARERYVFITPGGGVLYKADRWTGELQLIDDETSTRVLTPEETTEMLEAEKPRQAAAKLEADKREKEEERRLSKAIREAEQQKGAPLDWWERALVGQESPQ